MTIEKILTRLKEILPQVPDLTEVVIRTFNNDNIHKGEDVFIDDSGTYDVIVIRADVNGN